MLEVMNKSLAILSSLLLATTMGLAVDATEGYWMSPPLSGYAHVVTDPNDKFINPDVRTDFHSGLDGVRADMTVIVLDQLATPNTVKEKPLIIEQLKANGYLRRTD